MHNFTVSIATFIMVLSLLCYRIHLVLFILFMLLLLYLVSRLFTRWMKVARSIAAADAAYNEERLVNKNIHSLVDLAVISSSEVRTILPKTYSRYQQEYAVAIPKYLPEVTIVKQPENISKWKLKSLIMKHMPRIRDIYRRNCSNKADTMLAHALKIDKDSTKGMRNVLQAVLSKVDADKVPEAEGLFKTMRPTAYIEKQLGIRPTEYTDSRFSILNMSAISSRAVESSNVSSGLLTPEAHLNSWKEVTNNLEKGDETSARKRLESMRKVIPVHQNTIASSSTIQPCGSTSSARNSITTTTVDSDEVSELVSSASCSVDAIGSVSVAVTPSSSGRNSRYDPFFRLPSSEPPKTIAPVDMTGKSYAEKHAYKVYVEKFQKEQLAKQVNEQKMKQLKYEQMLSQAMNKFK